MFEFIHEIVIFFVSVFVAFSFLFSVFEPFVIGLQFIRIESEKAHIDICYFRQFFAKQLQIPAGKLCRFVIGKPERLYLFIAQIVSYDARHGFKSQPASGF